MKELKIPSKGTLSYWFKNIKLTRKEKYRLINNQKLAQERGLTEANKRRTQRIYKENQEAYKDGYNFTGRLSKKELFLIGAALYWAEGTKKQDNLTTEIVEFSNSDPDMIKLYMKFIRVILKPDEERIRAGIYIHDHVNEKEARNFWSKTTKLPSDRFFIVNSLSGSSKLKRPCRRLPHGTLKITISNRLFFYKIKGLIDALATANVNN